MRTLSRLALLHGTLRGTAVAGAALLAACGAPTQAPGPAAEISGEIQYASTVGGSGLEWEQAISKRFAERYPATKPTMFSLGSDPTTQLIALSAAGTPPDLYLLNNDLTAFYATKGLLQSLDARLARDKVDREDYHPIGLRTYQVKSTQVAMPYDLNSAGVYLNRTAFKEAGVAPPTKSYKDATWTADDLLETARKLTRGESPGAPKQFGYVVDTWIARWFPFLWGNGGDVFDNVNDPRVFIFNSKETAQTLQWLVDLRFRHQVAPQPADLQDSNPTKLFQTGRVAMLQENMSLQPDMDKVAGLEWDAVPSARGPKGRFTRVAGAGLGVHPGAKNAEGAWAFIKFHGGPEAWALGKGLQATMPPSRSASAVVLEGVAPELKKMWLETLEYGRTQALHLKWTELMEGDGARKIYTQALNGQLAVKDAMDAIKRLADAVLGS
jgi:ABC-type glycerol-3-phosphate transport system substrate-binding protein